MVISGDHSTAGGTIAGIKMAKPKSRLGVIWIDAHADLAYTLYNSIRKYAWDATGGSIGEDNEESKVHELDEETTKAMESIKKLLEKLNPKFCLKILFLFH